MGKVNISPKQRAFVDNLAEDLRKPPKERRTLGKLALDSGYSKTVSLHPDIVTNTDGVRLLFEQSGLTKSYLVQELKFDIDNKRGKENRTADLALAGKWIGLEKQDDLVKPNSALNVIVSENVTQNNQPTIEIKPDISAEQLSENGSN